MKEDDAMLDDLQWFELMAGRKAPGARPATRADAAWLRAALLSHVPQPPAGAMPEAGARASRLIARAAAAGLLQPVALVGWRRALHALRMSLQGWRGIGLSAVAALSLMLVLNAGRLIPPREVVDTERGAAVQQITAADARQRQQQVVQALRAAGLDARPYERLGRPGVDVELPQPLSAAHRAALQRLGLKAPAGPSLLIEIVAP